MKQTKRLTPKQDSFCVHYTTIGAETFSNCTKSAIAAGYSEKGAYARGSELLRNRKVLDRISELHTENMQRNMITVDKVLADLEHDKLMAREKGDVSAAIRADELQGKFLSMFVDRSYIEQDEQTQSKLTEEQVKEAAEYAKWRLLKRLTEPQKVQEGA